MIEEAQTADSSGEYYLIKSAAIPFADEAFDVIFSSFVFLEVATQKEIVAILKEMKRVLKKDGFIIFVTSILTNHKDRFISFDYDFEENDFSLLDRCHYVKLRIKSRDIVLYDYNYTEAEYLKAIEQSKLVVKEVYTPIGSEADPLQWMDEKTNKYFYIFVLSKDPTLSMINDSEFMLRAAKKMEQLSLNYCNLEENIAHPMKNKSNNTCCDWYHAAWGYCRYLDLIASPDLHSDYFELFFLENKNKKGLNILISGAADFTIIEHLINKIPVKQLPDTHITVLDMCLTPLKLCAWYEEVRKTRDLTPIQMKYIQLNAMHTELPSESFDLITTYSFLSRFDIISQKKVIDEWYRLLKRDGIVITSDRITPEYGLGFFESSESQVNYFVSSAKRKLEEMSESKHERDKILKLIYKYAQNISSYSCPSTQAMVEKFENFTCQVKTQKVKGELEVEEVYNVLYCKKIDRKEDIDGKTYS